MWEIKYWPNKEIERWFSKLTQDEAVSVAKEVALLKKIGNELKLPHSRSLKGKLFELRERKYTFRIYYAFYKDKIIVFLVAGDNKSHQDKDIELARKRFKKLISGDIKL